MLRKLTASYVNGRIGFVIYYAGKRKYDGAWVWKRGHALDLETVLKALNYFYEDGVRHGNLLSKEDRELIELIESANKEKVSVEVLCSLMGRDKKELAMVDWEKLS
jgi:hypothetical protein